MRLASHPIGDSLGEHAGQRKQQRRLGRLVARHHDRTAGGFQPRVRYERRGAGEERQPGMVVLGPADDDVSPFVQRDRGRSGAPHRALGVVVSGDPEQGTVQQPGQPESPPSRRALTTPAASARIRDALAPPPLSLKKSSNTSSAADGSERRRSRVLPGEARAASRSGSTSCQRERCQERENLGATTPPLSRCPESPRKTAAPLRGPRRQPSCGTSHVPGRRDVSS